MDGGGVASAGPGSTSTSATRIRDHHHPEEEEALIPEPNRINLQPKQTPPAENMYSTVSMSPRVPRKRGAGNGGNGSKEEEYEDFDDDMKRGSNMSPPGVTITPNSPSAGRSFSAHEMNSPTMNSSGSSIRPSGQAPAQHHHHQGGKSAWTQFDIETSDIGSKDDEIDGHEVSKRKGGVDVSLYTTKKNVAQGMLGIALLSANCSQLKYLLFHYERDANTLTMGHASAAVGAGGGANAPPSGSMASTAQWLVSFDFYFIINLVCIACSIALQVLVGILLILNSRHNIYVQRYQRVADSYSNLILLTVFLITIVNIFLSVFISAR